MAATSSDSSNKQEPPDKKPPCSCYEEAQGNTENCTVSSKPVDYTNGQIALSATDLSWQGFGFSWDHTRSYANVLGTSGFSEQGSNWFASSQPYLVFGSKPGVGPTIGVVNGTNTSIWFYEDVLGNWLARFGALDQLAHDTILQQFVLTDTSGSRLIFHSNSGSLPLSLRGRLKGMEDPSGSRGKVNYNLDDEIASIVWDNGEGLSAAFRYEYEDALELLGLYKIITLEVNRTPVRRVVYQYAEDGAVAGSVGDLLSARVEQWENAAWALVRQDAYRYYLAGEVDGFVHAVKMVFEPSATARLRAAGVDVLTASSTALQPYANLWFRYDASRRVIEERVDGGQHTYSFAWLNAFPRPSLAAVNTWNRRCIETTPDGNQTVVYSNRGGAELVRIRREVATGNQWVNYYQVDESQRVTLHAEPSAVATVVEPTLPIEPLTVTLHPTEGLVYINEYYAFTNGITGWAKGRYRRGYVQKGGTGVIKERQKSLTYSFKNVGAAVVHPIWTRNVLLDVVTNEQAETVYTRTWYQDDLGGPTFQVRQLKILPPVVPEDQHGTGLPEPAYEVYDRQGRLQWEKNGRGFITFRSYDEATDALVRLINDVDTARMNDVPEGWDTPLGGGLHLITDYVNDDQGRTLRTLRPWIEIDPATVNAAGEVPLRVRPVEYTYYRDVEHQRWEAQGYMTGEGAL